MREMEHLVEWELAGETEVLGGSFRHYHRPPKIPRELILRINPDSRAENPATDRNADLPFFSTRHISFTLFFLYCT
jgi:hypothetical protein